MAGCFQCEICKLAGGCLAGHDDDDYIPATKEQVIERLDNNEYNLRRDQMISYLKHQFNYDYNSKKNTEKIKTHKSEKEVSDNDNKIRTRVFDCMVFSSDDANKIIDNIELNNGKIISANTIPIVNDGIRLLVTYQALGSYIDIIQENINNIAKILFKSTELKEGL